MAPITLVTAPAGYGKTTAVCHWARETSMPVAWVAIAPGETDLTNFMERFADAVVSLLPAIGEECGEDKVDPLARLTRLLRAAGGTGEHVGIVLDHFELVEDQIVLDALTVLLQTLPPTIHLVIVSRTISNLGVGRLRVLRQVRDIGARQLAFDAEETIACLRAAEYPEMPLESVESRVREAEGWITGLMLSMAAGDSPGNSSTGSICALDHLGYLDSYVQEEVLAGLNAESRNFVQAACHLSRLEVGLCNHVLGIDSARAMLHSLVRQGVFLERGSDGLFRFHRLFAESVRRITSHEWNSDALHELHRRAGEWHTVQGQIRLAIDAYLSAEKWTRCIDLLRPLFKDTAGHELQYAMSGWLKRLPEHVLLADTELTFHHCRQLLLMGPHPEGRTFYERWIRPWHASDDPLLQEWADSCVALMAVYSGDHDALLQANRNRLRLIPHSNPERRLGALMGVIEVEFSRGNDYAVAEAFAEATRIRMQTPDDHHEWMILLVQWPANMQALRGNLREARNILGQETREFTGTRFDLRRRVSYRLALIALAQDDLEEANSLLDSYDDDLRVSLLPRWRLNSMICRALARRQMGDLGGSESLLLEVIEQARGAQDMVALVAARAALASIWVERKELPLVRRWLITACDSVVPWSPIFGIPNHWLVRAEALIALGRIDDALEHLDLVIAEGTERKRWAELVQAYVYRAVALERSAKRVEAIGAMEEAVDLGIPGGFIQPFLTPFDEVLALLERLTPSRKTNRYLARVLESVRKRGRSSTESLLSEREREILQLAQAGSSNQEIANRLFISQATVKRHLANVNLKLDTRNRVQAIARARELHLI